MVLYYIIMYYIILYCSEVKTESIKSLLCLFTLLERKQRHNNAGTRVVFLVFCYWLPFTVHCWYSTKRVGSQISCLYNLCNFLLGVVSMLQWGENNSLLDSQYFSVYTSSCMLQGRNYMKNTCIYLSAHSCTVDVKTFCSAAIFC